MKKTAEMLGKTEFVITLDDAYEMMDELFDNIHMSVDDKNVITKKIENAIGRNHLITIVKQIVANK